MYIFKKSKIKENFGFFSDTELLESSAFKNTQHKVKYAQSQEVV